MTTALYRRYRPDTFDDVIGQEHVTEPLKNALSKNKVNHAYLFSGPRGCGKTTSARILARCLNCVQGPTPVPCGECDSCRELATGGPGSLDVIEIDAASHGGVDDARDLRERATFAPTRDRYKIFIVDEAHMVSSAGFNALLKIVEEPPEHIKFIFATTEPDKVIGTIRSRTHHYPFRLVPPEPLMNYLESLTGLEHIAIAPGVLSLVVRAGGGSVRDTLSVLDQLIAGATEEGVSYELAVNLLGFTPESLLDDVVDSLAAQDSETCFQVIDRVIQSGQDPRRFVEDLLERLRDVVIVKAMAENAGSVLHGVSEDQIRRLNAQAAQMGAAELSRAADITAKALTEMVGATSPKLHLELLVARLMLPSIDETQQGLAARIERIERRLDYGAAPPAAPTGAVESTASGASATAATAGNTTTSGAALARATLRGNADDEQQPEPAPSDQPQQSEPPQAPPQHTQPDQSAEPRQPSPDQGSSRVEMVRRAWPEVINYLEQHSRLMWMTFKDNAGIAGFDGTTLTIGFRNDGAKHTAQKRGGEQIIAQAYQQILGLEPQVDLVVGSDTATPSVAAPNSGGSGGGGADPKAESRPTPAAETPAVTSTEVSAPPAPQTPTRSAPARESDQEPPSAETGQNERPGAPDQTPVHTGSAVSDYQPSAEELAELAEDEQAPVAWDEIPDEGETSPAPHQSPQQQPAPAPPQATQSASEPVAEDGYAGFIPTPDPATKPKVPFFAKPEAELRAEFQERFGDLIPTYPPKTPDSSTPRQDSASPAPPSAHAPDTNRPGTQNTTDTDPGSAETTTTPQAAESAPGEDTQNSSRPSMFQQMMNQYRKNTAHNTVASSPVHPPAPSPQQHPHQDPSDRHPEPATHDEPAPVAWNEEVASEDDVLVEDSGLVGRPVLERILNARLVEELNPDGTPKFSS
ncbi:DNA polymerase III subunit gamma and tau [Auritidibacter ignavus]|uniref:DNA polymerase III subunit gamma and tau n=1 Tax=Auritidibacter ignavus TaxID=678932 RepID=UPI00244B08B3|nr:DNA polymerase III subunit gamma and tau [Auritidibacter ignavus]WGH82924.1 DNA polymerase III subunit gamma and tau [Auritidibacter ignavus]